VLVEEINPKVDNFGIYIDNYHCDVNDEVSCPRTLIVRHETQEVLIKTVQMTPIEVQVCGCGQAGLPLAGHAGMVFSSRGLGSGA
jgi:mucin-2